jgi:hypothetical protein
MDRRRSRRWPRQLDVRFWKRGEEGQATHAVSTNVSRTGIFLRTQQVLPNGTRLRLEVSCAGRSFLSEGVVMRALKTPSHLQAAMPSGMGVRFLHVEELLEDLLPGINLLAEERVPAGVASPSLSQPTGAAIGPLTAVTGGSGQPRASTTSGAGAATSPVVGGAAVGPAAPAPPAAARPATVTAPATPIGGGGAPFPLRFRDREQFRRVYERDIQTGGLFISTDAPPALDTVLEVEVSVDGVPEPPVRLQARVVHRLDPQPGGPAGNLLAGVGVQFLDMGRAVEQLRALLG